MYDKAVIIRNMPQFERIIGRVHEYNKVEKDAIRRRVRDGLERGFEVTLRMW